VSPLIAIIHEDAELLVINKPAGLVCHPTKAGPLSSLIGRVRVHLGGGAHPQLVNRLDRETSGVVLVAQTAQTARALRRLWETRQVHKTYLALVHGVPAPAHGLIDAPLGKDERSAVAIKDCVRPDGAPAQTEYWVEHTVRRPEGEFSLLRLAPRTGRKHQARLHLAHVGHPIVGDKLYGGEEGAYLAFVAGRLSAAQQERLLLPYHALHASEVQFPWRDRDHCFRAEPEAWFTEFLAGGAGQTRQLQGGLRTEKLPGKPNDHPADHDEKEAAHEAVALEDRQARAHQ
jgi:23S rRNA pseudouridine1911/1915/1917 synthase